jgi:hypothetical protein
MTTGFKVLGPLKVVNGNRDCTPPPAKLSPAKLRMVHAFLLLNASYAVSVNCLIEDVTRERLMEGRPVALGPETLACSCS